MSCSRSAKPGSQQFVGTVVTVAKIRRTRSLAPYRATEEAYSRGSVQLRKHPTSDSAPYRATKEVSPQTPTYSFLLNPTTSRPVKHPAFLAFETAASVQPYRSISGEDEPRSGFSENPGALHLKFCCFGWSNAAIFPVTGRSHKSPRSKGQVQHSTELLTVQLRKESAFRAGFLRCTVTRSHFLSCTLRRLPQLPCN